MSVLMCMHMCKLAIAAAPIPHPAFNAPLSSLTLMTPSRLSDSLRVLSASSQWYQVVHVSCRVVMRLPCLS